MKKEVKVLLVVLLMFVSNIGWAQQAKITGTVKDQDGNELPGVTIVVKGTTSGTVSDSDGNFSLNAAKGSVLVFSFVGMNSQEIQIENQSEVDVVLEEESVGIEEVVAIGYGTMKKSDVTGAMVSISEEKIKSIPAIDLLWRCKDVQRASRL